MTPEPPPFALARLVGGLALVSLLAAAPLARAQDPAAAPPPAAPSSTTDARVEAILDAVQARYASGAGMRARFLQTSTNIALAESTEARGECWFAKPGKMRWVYETPEVQSLVSDGTTLWFHQPTRYQVMVSEIPPELASRIPTSFFSGTGDLGEDYIASAVEPESIGQTSAGELVDLVPREGGEPAPFRKLRISVDRERDLVTAIEIHDLFGNVNRLDFQEIEILESLDEALFTFEIPEGTHVVRPPGS